MNKFNKKLTITAAVAVFVGAMGAFCVANGFFQLKNSQYIEQQVDNDSIGQVELVEPVKPVNLPVNPRVAVIKFYDSPNFDKVQDTLVKILKDPEIKGVLLYVDNTGGSVAHYACISDLVSKVNEIKPVVSYVIGIAASGGYMVASASDCIISSSMADIGNIGAYIEIQKHKNLKASGSLSGDVDIEMFTAGEFKNITNPYADSLNQKEKDFMQEYVDTSYTEFREFVVKRRKSLDPASYEDWAEGKVFTASKAKELGLIDATGTVIDAENKVLELIKLRNPDTNLGNSINPVFC